MATQSARYHHLEARSRSRSPREPAQKGKGKAKDGQGKGNDNDVRRPNDNDVRRLMGTDAEGQGNDPTDGDSDDSEDSDDSSDDSDDSATVLCLNCEKQLRCSYEPGVGYTCQLCTVIRELQETLRQAREQNVDIDAVLVQLCMMDSLTQRMVQLEVFERS